MLVFKPNKYDEKKEAILRESLALSVQKVLI
jgi:hypothetical protein